MTSLESRTTTEEVPPSNLRKDGVNLDARRVSDERD
jgi:hypothetical protein